MRWLLSVALLATACQISPLPQPTATPEPPERRLQAALGTSVTLAPDRLTLDRYVDALSKELAARAGVFPTSEALGATMAQVPNNTRVLVLEVDGPQTRVRVQDGEHMGREGWVYTTEVIPLRSSNSP